MYAGGVGLASYSPFPACQQRSGAIMSGNPKQPTQFIVDEVGRRTAAVVDIEYWDALMDLLEDLEDLQLVRDAMSRLEDGPEAVGAVRWADARDEL